jgi:hypothetical protein
VKLFDVNQTVMIVVGSSVPQEMADRPLAYNLKEAIDKHGEAVEWRHAVVVSDLAYESDAVIQGCPTIAIGSIAANAVSARLVNVLPIALTVKKTIFVQLDITYRDRRVLLWGTDPSGTEAAVDIFLSKGYLEKYLKHIWRY